jgi:hypothetical protein
MRSRRVLALFLLLAACGGASSMEDLDSGIVGVVLLGPQCPVVQEGSPCPDEPIAADVVVTDTASGREVASARSGEDGRFRISVPPGQYVVQASTESTGGPPTAKPVNVTVEPHQFTEVTVPVDTGIR